MRCTIWRSSNGLVVSLPDDLLDALHLSEDAEVDVNLDLARGIITIAPAPVAGKGVGEDFARQVSEFIDQHRPALETLARS